MYCKPCTYMYYTRIWTIQARLKFYHMALWKSEERSNSSSKEPLVSAEKAAKGKRNNMSSWLFCMEFLTFQHQPNPSWVFYSQQQTSSCPQLVLIKTTTYCTNNMQKRKKTSVWNSCITHLSHMFKMATNYTQQDVFLLTAHLQNKVLLLKINNNQESIAHNGVFPMQRAAVEPNKLIHIP